MQIGLPLDRQRVPLLCILDPFLAANQLVVTPYANPTLSEGAYPYLTKPLISQSCGARP